MGKRREVDEQGQAWPPRLALVAEFTSYAGNENSCLKGAVVEVADYKDGHFLFEVTLLSGVSIFPAGDTLLARMDELRPLNAHTAAYLEDQS